MKNLFHHCTYINSSYMLCTFTCFTYGTGTINSSTSISPIDLDRHNPPCQHLSGPIWIMAIEKLLLKLEPVHSHEYNIVYLGGEGETNDQVTDKKKGCTQCRRLPALCEVCARVSLSTKPYPYNMQKLGLEPGTFRLQTVDSTAAPVPPFDQLTDNIHKIKVTYPNTLNNIYSSNFTTFNKKWQHQSFQKDGSISNFCNALCFLVERPTGRPRGPTRRLILISRRLGQLIDLWSTLVVY